MKKHMTYKLRYLPLAMDDIDQLSKYLTRFYPSTAGRFLRDLKEKISRLQSFPQLYAEYPHDPYYRSLPVRGYIVFYHVDEQAAVVEIHRILRGSWDLPKFLDFQEPKP